jgi:apolipoprotein N-acyltransferase
MILKYAHIALIFSGIAAIYGTEILLHRIGRSGDTRSIRTAFAVARPVATFGPALFWVGVAFGAAAGVVNGYNMLAPWLLTTYVLVAILLVAGVTITVPWMGRVGSLSAAAPDGPASAELSAALHDRRVNALMYASILVDFAIVALMVFKPGA